MIVNIPKIRGYLLAISTNFSRLSTDQSGKQEADLALPSLTGRMMALSTAVPGSAGDGLDCTSGANIPVIKFKFSTHNFEVWNQEYCTIMNISVLVTFYDKHSCC
eukprot:SAG31_NODE_1652_length_7628_cov_100.866118_2_plen_105_part_00